MAQNNPQVSTPLDQIPIPEAGCDGRDQPQCQEDRQWPPANLRLYRGFHVSHLVVPGWLRTITDSQRAALGYETLADAVADPVDGRLWSDGLEIDELRVGKTTLRQNHKTTLQVLAGLARSKTQSGVFRVRYWTSLLRRTCLHLTTRMDEPGEQYIQETDGELLRSQFWRHPHPDKDVLFVSKSIRKCCRARHRRSP